MRPFPSRLVSVAVAALGAGVLLMAIPHLASAPGESLRTIGMVVAVAVPWALTARRGPHPQTLDDPHGPVSPLEGLAFVCAILAGVAAFLGSIRGAPADMLGASSAFCAAVAVVAAIIGVVMTPRRRVSG